MVLGSEIRDPRSGIRKKPIPDPGSRIQGSKSTQSRIPDPGSGSATLFKSKLNVEKFSSYEERLVRSALRAKNGILKNCIPAVNKWEQKCTTAGLGGVQAMQLHTGAEHFGNVIIRYCELTSQYHFDASIDVNRM